MRSLLIGAVTLMAVGCGTDADKDGFAAAFDCDDNDPAIGDTIDWFADVDGDGYGDPAVSEGGCTGPSGYVTDNTDCNDSSPLVNPGATEACNGADDDCDGDIDEEAEGQIWYTDSDGDGHGDVNSPVDTCDPGAGLVSNSTDCNDADNATYPGAAEVCDGSDNDCDGAVDDNATDGTPWYRDQDQDGYGSDETLFACDPPAGYAAQGGDCDDADDSAWPGAEEVCDNIDNDCNDLVDDSATDATSWYIDDDGDGYGDASDRIDACHQPDGYVDQSGDCNDANATISPETWWYPDGDGDDFGLVGPDAVQQCSQPAGHSLASGDCDDGDDTVYPGADELCDSVDNDCDTIIDEDASDAIAWYVDTDGDGYGFDGVAMWSCDDPGPAWSQDNTDCDDTTESIHPGHDEVCDDVDNDCNGFVDEADPGLVGVPSWFPDIDEDGYGEWAGHVETCDPPSGYVLDGTDCDDADPEVHLGALELCDGYDNDCDSLIDGADAVDSVPVYTDADADGYGDPTTETYVCSVATGQVLLGTDCDDADPNVHPNAEEDCSDTQDYNCDGNFGLVDGDGDSVPACNDCDDTEPSAFPGGTEVCDHIDNDCNGMVDDDGAGGYPWQWYLDEDQDGYGLTYESVVWCEAGQPLGYVQQDGDCNDEVDTIHPFAIEECNLIDDDCDGIIPPDEVDMDGDGFTPTSCGGSDCDDAEPLAYLGAEEICGDGIDNDCIDGDAPCVEIFSGVRTNVEQSTLTGWEECFVDKFRDSSSIATITDQCTKSQMMIGCRRVGTTELVAVAYAPIADVMTNTGTGNTVHSANGVDWYFHTSYSWGYTHQGDGVSRNSCDTQTGMYPQHRVCFHTSSNRLSGGYRCGTTTGLNSSSTWERVFLHAEF